jgi:ubiquitin-conjugating enzyme E2 M
MIKLFSVKQKQKEDAQNNNGRPIKKQSAGELRVQKGASPNIILPFYFRFPR